jgi:hypothetical protein
MSDWIIETAETTLVRRWYHVFDVPDAAGAFEMVTSGAAEEVASEHLDTLDRAIKNTEKMPLPEFTHGRYKVIWEDIGEGYEGEYNPDDPNDEHLLRFYIERMDSHGHWNELPDSSYCTVIPVDTTYKVLETYASLLLTAVETQGSGYRRVLQGLTWLTVENLRYLRDEFDEEISNE